MGDSCEVIKPPSKAALSPMGTMPVRASMDRLGTDILGSFPETQRGNSYVLVVTDYLPNGVKYLVFLTNQTAGWHVQTRY